MIGAVGGLGLTTTLTLNVLERRREIGILRAIGASPRQLWLLLIAEAEVIGLASWALATMAASVLTKVLGAYLARTTLGASLDSNVEQRGIWIRLAVSIVLAAVRRFADAPAMIAIREALSYE